VDLERMTLRLRPRNAWEALDVGLLLVRDHGKSAYIAWLAIYVPVAALALVVFQENPFFAWATLWWLKPLFDRVVLEVLSAELFGGEVRIAQILRRLPSMLWRSGIVGALTWRRLDFARSLHLPVYQLERLTGKASRQRIRLLDREARGAGIWLSFLLFNIEGIFTLALSLAMAILLPVQVPMDVILETWLRGTFGPTADLMGGVILAAIAMTAIEPLFVACGFTLYLQRRTALEGWDIELRFRQLTSRIESLSRVAGTAGLVTAFLLAACLAFAPMRDARADESDRAAKEVQQILKDPEFGHEEQRWHLVYVGPNMPERKGEPINWEWLEKVLGLGAKAARVGAWVLFALAAAFLLYYLAKYIRLRAAGRTRGARPDFLFGLDVRPESLPDDVAGTSESLAREGRVREALSLLYRASLVRLMDEGLEFTQGDTEGDCLRRVKASAPRRHAFFASLVNAWQLLAYGHRPVTAATVEQFAREWRTQFPQAGMQQPEAKAA
jgi:hypothetical protein